MLYKNSIKLLFSNFNIVWKMMLYFLVVFVISGGLIFLFVNPIIKMVEDAGFFSQFVDLYADFLSTLNLPKMLQNLGVFVDGLFEFIIENISKMWFRYL